MNRIVSLINQKNHYLEKFYALNERELDQFIVGNFDSLNSFYETRERILEMIRYIDGQIEELTKRDSTSVTSIIKDNLREALTIKDLYVEKILEQDLKILSCIESAKSEIIRELQDLKKTQKAVSGYKSPVFKQRLNEEV